MEPKLAATSGKQAQVRSNTTSGNLDGSARTRWAWGLVLALILLSIPMRWEELGKPLVGLHAFRQTQTAITVWSFLEEGVHPLEYQTPILGPPWRVPMEFPIFQMTAYIPAKLGLNIDAACRLTNLFYFYLSTFLLFQLCRDAVPETRVAEYATIVFCWTPFNIYWSAQCMIDFASVAFALGYAVTLIRWVKQPGWKGLFIVSLAFGAAAYLCKVTTMAAFVVPIGSLTLLSLLEECRRQQSLLNYLKSWWKPLTALVFLVVFPLLAGWAWMQYSDEIKSASPFTRWLMAGNLRSWSLGPMDQRLTPVNWWTIGKRIGSFLPPFGFLTLFLIGILGLRQVSIRGRVLFLSASAGVILPIAVFFHLYLIHDYYLMAIAAPVAIIAGFGADRLLTHKLRKVSLAPVAAAVFISFCAWVTFNDEKQERYAHLYPLAVSLRSTTHPDDRLVVMNNDWDSFVLFHARRKGFMVREMGYGREPIDEHILIRFLKKNRFNVVVSSREQPWLVQAWNHKFQLPAPPGYSVFQVSDVPIESHQNANQ